jgi:phosphate butyryltransferase
MFKTMEELLTSRPLVEKTAAVVCAADSHTLEAVLAAARNGCIRPVLIGDKELIRRLIDDMEFDVPFAIQHAANADDAVKAAVSLVCKGEAGMIVKGMVETGAVMRQIVHSDSGIRQSPVLSHLTISELPSYHKLIGTTDCALLTYPTLEQKIAAIKNAAGFFHRAGIETVKVACLCAIETVNPKMPETVEARALRDACERGELPGCIVEGPISYDLAVSSEAAEAKGFRSPVAGDADLLLVPNIVVGNVLTKCFSFTAGGFSAAVVLGARVPVVITSRGSKFRTKMAALRLAAAM